MITVHPAPSRDASFLSKTKVSGTNPETYSRAWTTLQLENLTDIQKDEAFYSCGVDPHKAQYTNNENAILVLKAASLLRDENLGHCHTKIPMGTSKFAFRIMDSADTLLNSVYLGISFNDNFFPSRKIRLEDHGNCYRLLIYLDGISEEGGAAAELAALLPHINRMNAFIGKSIPIEAIYSRSKILTQSIHYNSRFESPVFYANFTGVDIRKEFFDMPRAAHFSGDSFENAIRWFFLKPKIQCMKNSNDLPIINAESIYSNVEKISRQRNIDLRQKRRIAYGETSYNLRSLMNGVKLARAIDLLCGTSMTLGEISIEIGFSDVRCFYRFFQQYFPQSPSEYRRKFGTNVFGNGKSDLEMALEMISEIENAGCSINWKR